MTIQYQDFKVQSLPSNPVANAVYYVKSPGATSIVVYVTDQSGAAFPIASGSFVNLRDTPITLNGYGITDGLTQSDAAATYLTQSNASSTYLSQAAASAAYLTTVNAAIAYLSKADAAATYLAIELLAPSATVDTTNASNITSGLLGSERLPIATDTTIGAVKIGPNLIVSNDGTLQAKVYGYSFQLNAFDNGAFHHTSEIQSLSSVSLNASPYAKLPAAPVAGQLAYISDCTSTTGGAVASGGGNFGAFVGYKGTNWVVLA